MAQTTIEVNTKVSGLLPRGKTYDVSPNVKEATMTDVKCSVDNCAWWSQGNNCSASKIDVAAGPPESIPDNPGMSMDLETPVDNDLQTHCHTFSQAA